MSSTPGRTTPSSRTGSRDRLRVAATLLWSVAVWVALWGDLSVANVLWGAVLGAATLVLVPIAHRAHRLPLRPVLIMRFVGLFAWSLVKASAVVAWEVVTPRNDINEGIIEIPLRTSSPGLITLVSNVVTLTPGTLTLVARQDPPTIYVHVLHLRGIEDVRRDIRRFEDAVLAAFVHEPSEHAAGTTTEGERP